jgi:signal transduction histidine kinase
VSNIRRLTLTNAALLSICAVLVALFFIIRNNPVFADHGFMPHGHCYLWSPALVWTMVVTDALIGIAYVSISLCLYFLVRRIKLPFSTMFLAFGIFIAACGATHFMSIYTLWQPDYWLDALIKIVTALASVATALILYPLFPKVIALAETARLSEQRRLQLEDLNRELELRTEALMTANRELEAFSYTVSHDLRSPLRGIDGFSQALLEDHSAELSDEGKQFLTHVRSGAQRMGQIIDDLLALAKITRAEIVLVPVDLSKIAKETAEYLKAQEPERQATVEVELNLSCLGDPGLIRILVENLLGNAWKFSSRNSDTRIEVGSQRVDRETFFYIRDNGAGFDMQYSNKLFTAFQRLHSSADYKGSGIGLATVKRIVDKHSGSIRAESELTKGTTIFFTLPEVTK